MRTSRPSGGFVTGFDDDHSNSVVCIRVFCVDREGKNAGAEIPGIMLSVYTLVISVTGITKIISFIRNGFKEYLLVKTLLAIPMVEKLVNESMFRTELTMYTFYAIL